MQRINVTKTFLPPIYEYEKYVSQIWKSDQLTNQGPLLNEFEGKIKEYLEVENFQFVTNGTLALQVALRALDITSGEVITTPFSYVASTSAILWERCEPVFVDINPETLCIDPDKIEDAITEKTKAILAVHVFGRPCDVERIDALGRKYDLKVIYDGAHAFGVRHGGKSLLSYGDISICSFHATKVFHTIEGGGVFTSSKEVNAKVDRIKRFGHDGDEHFMLGTNAKASEFQAAMGLANLKYIDGIIERRKELTSIYDQNLPGLTADISTPDGSKSNYGYYPVLLETEDKLHLVLDVLKKSNIFPRRYFYPSLNTLPYLVNSQNCPVSEDISLRILCLPLYIGLDEDIIVNICKVVRSCVSKR